MNKAQKTIAGFLIVAVIAIAVLFSVYLTMTGKSIVQVPEGEVILYYGETCPHCIIVEEFLVDNNVDDKIKITRKEVFSNAENAKELVNLGRYYNLEEGYIGAVPLLYAEEKVYIGDVDIIDYFKSKLMISV